MGFFHQPVSFSLDEEKARDITGPRTESDFDSFRLLKKYLDNFFDNFECPECGGHKVTGSGVVVSYGKVHLFEIVESKGWFGGKKYKEKKYATVWRLHGYRIRNAAGRCLINMFGLGEPGPGKLQCNARGCEWMIKGTRGGTMSVSDILNIVSGS